MESIVGKILCDRYRIVRELSQDDFSTIFDAEDLATPEQPECQIEQLQPSYDSEVLGAKSWQRVSQAFVRQGNIFQNISQHPQIPQLLAFFECDRSFYLVREYIKGQTLSQKLELSLIDETSAIDWLKDILGILDFIHQAGITHLNIQPSSIIEQYDNKKFLTNFSTVKDTILFDKSTVKSPPNTEFMPPEQTEGITDFSTDIYALGKTIIYALNGKKNKPAEVSSLSKEQLITSTNIRAELADILKKMVEERSDRRYQSAAEVLNELDFGKQVVTLPPPMFANFQQPIASTASDRYTSGQKTNKSKSANKHKFIWLLLALPFVVASAIISIGINKNAYDGYQTYSDINYRFVIKYPQNWSERSLDDPITGDIVVFSSPLGTNGDLFREKVYLTVEYLSSDDISLEQYTQNVVERIRQAQGSKIKVESDRSVSISKLPTSVVTYNRTSDNMALKQMEAFAIKGDRAYIAIYTAEATEFDKFLDTVNKTINSWSIE